MTNKETTFFVNVEKTRIKDMMKYYNTCFLIIIIKAYVN